MFKKKTFSDILDKHEKNEKETIARKEAYAEAMVKEKQERIITVVNSQFQYAKQTIGHRFSMNQQHYTMFYFYFSGWKQRFCCSLYSHILDPEGDFELREYSFPKNLNSKIKQFKDRTFKLNKLADNLLEWAKIIIEEELQQKG